MATLGTILKDDAQKAKRLASDLAHALVSEGDLHEVIAIADELSSHADDIAVRVHRAVEALNGETNETNER